MTKKFISMATAVLLMASGISFVGVTSANAAPSTNVDLRNIQTLSGSTLTTIAGFDPAILNYTRTSSIPTARFYSAMENSGNSKTVTCNGVTLPNDNTDCDLVSGANTFAITVTGSNNLTKVYTITVTYTPPSAPVMSSTSTITVGQVNPTIVIQTDTGAFFTSANSLLASYSGFAINVGTTGLTRGASVVSGAGDRTVTIAFSGTASAGTITFKVRENVLRFGPESNTLSFVVGGGSSPAPSTPEQIAAAAAQAAAAAAAAAQAAAVARAAEIATAQTALATVLRGDKAGSLSEYRAANINITTTAALTRLNAEVLKLSAADRADFAKIKAIADKIEFDESFFNATARPSLATYSSYGVTGVTERILPVINAKVLELPAALRADVKAMQELVKVESFVDRVANPVTRTTVSAAVLVSRGLLTAENPRRHSIVNGLARYPEGSLNTMAKIEAAIKEQIFIAEAPKRRLAEIKARMAARKK